MAVGGLALRVTECEACLVEDRLVTECEACLVEDRFVTECEACLVEDRLLTECEACLVEDRLVTECEARLVMGWRLGFKGYGVRGLSCHGLLSCWVAGMLSGDLWAVGEWLGYTNKFVY